VSEIRIIPVQGVPEIGAGDDLAERIVAAAGPGELRDGDIVVIAHKVVSKAEGRLADATDRRAVALAESAHILRRRGDVVISVTAHGLVCANAGVDASNVSGGSVALLPLDPDLSARRARARMKRLTGAEVAVVISDTFGRPWRLGQVNVAIGLAGIEPFIDYRGAKDTFGRELTATQIAVADEIAGAAELVMGKTRGICAAIVRGAEVRWGQGRGADIIRPTQEDMFR
jgi:coenzyme F420-0:L-glutamate ligase / coenzyme F420-1:gamma-L-glutamate ligase